jgi:Domain of unknown function (DUF6898)
VPPDDRKTGRSSNPAGRNRSVRGASGNSGNWGEGDLGEVYFEFVPVGNYMRVNAIHAATGTETFALGPLNASRSDLQRIALRKLTNALNSKP